MGKDIDNDVVKKAMTDTIDAGKITIGELNANLIRMINLDEPEGLTQEWIDEHSVAVSYDEIPDQVEVVYVDDLEKLINQKEEK